MRNLFAGKDDAATVGNQFAGNQVDQGGLAGAVGADQGVDFAVVDWPSPHRSFYTGI